MSCETISTAVATRAAPKNGLSRTGSKNGFIAGSTPQVSFFVIAENGQTQLDKTTSTANGKAVSQPAAGTRRTKVGKQTVRRRGRRKATKSDRPGTNGKSSALEAKVTEAVPTQRRASLGQAFSPDELSKLSVQLRFGLAAANRHVRTLGRGGSRDIGHGDPRPSDWARLDVKQFEFLTNQLAIARRGDGVIDLASLKRGELVDLWEFLRFEADRALRNIDHLQTPGGPIRGETADYLAQNHKLEARFFTHLANQIETLFPAENIQAEYPTGPGGSF
ncbi:hypothetical protein ACFLXQ_02885 [Chloroflexota bacterium]